MSTITLYGTEEGWEVLEKKNLSLEEHGALAAGLAGAIQQLHAFWLEQRREQVTGGTLPDVVRRSHGNSSAMRIRCASARSGPRNASTNSSGGVVPLTLMLRT